MRASVHYHENSIYNNIFFNFNLARDLYFNTGVMLLNLKQIRSENAQNDLVNAIDQYAGHTCVKLFDQDVINIVYQGHGRGKIKALDSRWNVNPNSRYQPLSDIFIIHYVGPLKPWKVPIGPYRMEYLEYAKLTPYFSLIREDLLKAIDVKINYLKNKLPYKKYLFKRSLFDIRVFGKDVFASKVAHYNRKIKAFLDQKKEKSLYLDYLNDLKAYLEK